MNHCLRIFFLSFFLSISGTDLFSKSAPELIMTEVSVKRFDISGNLKETLETKKLYRFSHEGDFYLTQPKVTLIKTNELPWYIQANYATMPPKKGIITLQENVNIYQETAGHVKETIFKTETLFYNPTKKLAQTNLPISFEKPGTTVVATGMKAWLETRKIELLHQTKMTYQPNHDD